MDDVASDPVPDMKVGQAAVLGPKIARHSLQRWKKMKKV